MELSHSFRSTNPCVLVQVGKRSIITAQDAWAQLTSLSETEKVPDTGTAFGSLFCLERISLKSLERSANRATRRGACNIGPVRAAVAGESSPIDVVCTWSVCSGRMGDGHGCRASAGYSCRLVHSVDAPPRVGFLVSLEWRPRGIGCITITSNTRVVCSSWLVTPASLVSHLAGSRLARRV